MDIRGYIRQQPSVMEAMLSDKHAFGGIGSDFIHGCRHILLIGTGSSMNAIVASAFQFRGLGPSVSHVSPMTAVKDVGRCGPETVAIMLSQSGQSKDAVEAADMLLAARCRTIVMTADAASSIAKLDCKRVILPVADETVGPKTKGYFASVLGLCLLAKTLDDAWPDVDAPGLSETLSAWTDRCDAWATKLAPELSKADVLAVLGQRSQLGTALEGSLKIAEMSGVPAFGEETEEMSHGRFHGLTRNSHVFFIVDDATQREFASRLSAALIRFEITPHIVDMKTMPESEAERFCSIRAPRLPEGNFWKVLFAVVPFQLLAVHTAMTRGRVPEKMRYPDMGRYLGLKLQVPA